MLTGQFFRLSLRLLAFGKAGAGLFLLQWSLGTAFANRAGRREEAGSTP